MSIKITKDHALTHEENRYKVCIICQRKKSVPQLRKISDVLRKLILKFFEYDIYDDRVPKSICLVCKKNIYSAEKKGDYKSLKIPDYSKYVKIVNSTRSKKNVVCKCTLCQISQNCGVPSNFTKNRNQKPKTKNLIDIPLSCSNCLSALKTKSHTCNSEIQLKNLTNYVSNLNLKKKRTSSQCTYKKNIK